MLLSRFQQLARECGFELSGAAAPDPLPDAQEYLDWAARGLAGDMRYLTDHRAGIRADPRLLLPSVRSILSVGKLYNTPHEPQAISRYAWGRDYHDVMRRDLKILVERIQSEAGPFDYKICVDTAPLLERSYAREAGLGWIGKNTCLINQEMGSWFFLGEILASLEIERGSPPPDRCGTCTRCIDACPTEAIVPGLSGRYELDARLCISYFTIELRGAIPEESRAGVGGLIFGCDICQDVCPWNGRAPYTVEAAFEPRHETEPLEKLAALSRDEFESRFDGSPVRRARYSGFLRNVVVAMGNNAKPEHREALERLAQSDDSLVSEHARWAIEQVIMKSKSIL
jgi:epoxyqueuosine reductase